LTAFNEFHDHGYLLSRSEVAALAGISGTPALLLLDGGLGLLDVGENSTQGRENLMFRGLVGLQGASQIAQPSEFLAAHLTILKSREFMVEFRIADPSLPVQVSHWIAVSGGSASVVRTTMVDGQVRFWFAIIATRQVAELAWSLAEFLEPSSGGDEMSPLTVRINNLSKFVIALGRGDFSECDLILHDSGNDEKSSATVMGAFSCPFRSTELVLERRSNVQLVIGQFNWIETSENAVWTYDKNVSDGTVSIQLTSVAQANAAFRQTLGDFA